MQISGSSNVLDEHVQLAAAFLLCHKPEQRPKTLEKLATALHRRGCCRVKLQLSPAALAIALRDMLGEKHVAYGYIAPLALAAEHVFANKSNLVIDESVKAAAQHAVSEIQLANFAADPLLGVAHFLCHHAQMRTTKSTKPTDLVGELVARRLVSTVGEGPCLKIIYNDDELSKVPKMHTEHQTASSWISIFRSNSKAEQIYRSELEKHIGVEKVNRMSWRFVLPMRKYFSEAGPLAQKLNCILKPNFNHHTLEVQMRKTTKLGEKELREVLPFFVGPNPAFQVESSHASGQIIGKRGRNIKSFTIKVPGIFLTLDTTGDRNKLSGWLSESVLPHTIDDSGLVKELKDICKKKREQLTKVVETFLDDLKAAASAASQRRAEETQLTRTFSSEYNDRKEGRAHEIARNQLKNQAHKNHIHAKIDREHKNWKKSHDKGPAFHGARYKPGEAAVEHESSYVNSSDLPPEEAEWDREKRGTQEEDS